MSIDNKTLANLPADVKEELLAARAELEIAKAEARATKADAEATKAEAEAIMAEAEATMAEAKALKAEAEVLMLKAKSAPATTSDDGHVARRTEIRCQSQPTRAASQIEGAVAISSMEEKGKLPKDRIVLYHEEYEKVGITNFRAAFIKDYSYDDTSNFVLNGEYDGKTKKGLLIIIMVFNEHNEMIGTDFDERIGEKISSHKTFSTSLTLPNYEQISRVEVRIVKDPSLWD